MGMRLLTRSVAPRRVPAAACRARAARTTRSDSAGDTRRALGPLDRAVLADRDGQRVAQIDELKDSLQLVVAVRAPAGDVEEEIQLGRRGPEGLPAAHRRHPSTTIRTRTPARRSVSRRGSHSAPTGM